MYVQSCNLTYQRINHFQTVPSQRSRNAGLPGFSRIEKDSLDCSEHVAIATGDLFEVLREHVDALNQNWMDRLTLCPSPDDKFLLSSPYEKGIQSLQEFYGGKLQGTFEEIFALMHIVHACAWIYHEKDETHFWHTFFLNVRQWRYAIATQKDALLFLEVASLLWPVPECSEAEAAEYSNDFLSQLRWGHCHQSTPQDVDQLDTPELIQLRNMLKEEQALSPCTRYLDGKLLLGMKIIICLELKMYRF